MIKCSSRTAGQFLAQFGVFSAVATLAAPRAMSRPIRKTLKVIWVVFCVTWTALCSFAAFLGAGMSVGDANIEPAFLLYWLGPIMIPAVVYWLINRLLE